MTIDEFVNRFVESEGSYAFILRGIPGSGKTTLALKLAHSLGLDTICSADKEREKMYDGKYIFKPEDNGEVHARCFRSFIAEAEHYSGLEEGQIICDNTNTTVAELAPYVAAANAFGFSPLVVTVCIDPAIAGQRNTHGVPQKTINRMHYNLKTADKHMPPYWECFNIEGVVTKELEEVV